MYPSTHTKYEVPDIRPKNLKTAELLHHRYHIKDKIKRLAKLKRESRREAVVAMKRRRKEEICQNGADISMGVSRTQNIFAINRSIANHWTLLAQVEEQIKVRLKTHKCNSESIFFDDEQAGQIKEPSIMVRPTRHRRQHPRPCRHHTRPHRFHASDGDEEREEQSCESEPPTFLQELRRQRLKRWEQRKSTFTYRTAHDRVGGYVSAAAEDSDSGQLSEDRRLTVCTINVAGFDDGDNKLELIL